MGRRHSKDPLWICFKNILPNDHESQLQIPKSQVSETSFISLILISELQMFMILVAPLRFNSEIAVDLYNIPPGSPLNERRSLGDENQ